MTQNEALNKTRFFSPHKRSDTTHKRRLLPKAMQFSDTVTWQIRAPLTGCRQTSKKHSSDP